ncbi:LacI family DNA-binding transcriptional regulator [Pseudaestuariivita atlantica]|uniref:LacI family transcriptional regulator n=1 Tax=Pseudaestuariivita atlantica TaxID=1317121 RepID=A0A0L1JU15_9RHOB|nr:substrate-binding domain-containing protein [Pseudaestuariivita atlantica]KNG94898.1 LacI family transcriptional regulator [Pseudaestuariivita atlantica]
MGGQINNLAPRQRRVTISDVSEALGLTKGTVSRALNGYPDISETTRLKVARTAERMGYRPLAHAQAIRTGRVRSVGLVFQFYEHDGHRPFLADFLTGISGAASAEGWTLTLATASSQDEMLATLDRLVDERKVDGFILPRTYRDDPRIETLRRAGVPFVLFGRTGDDTGCAWFDIAGEAAMANAVARLAALGHTRIGFVQGGEGANYAHLRLDGYIAGMQAAGLAIDDDLIAPPSLNPIEGCDAGRRLLSLTEPPTAIVCAVDQAALGLYDAARERGLAIGREVSVISYDGIPEGRFVDPPLSTFAVDNRAAGERLTQMLIERVRGTDPHALRDLADASFLDRGSHGPPVLSSAQLARRVRASSIM